MPHNRTHRRLRLGFFGALSVVVLGLAGCAGEDGGGSAGGGELSEVVLNFSTLAPSEENSHGLSAIWFMDEVTKRTDGRVTFDASFLEAACPAAEQYQCVTDGRSDIALGVPNFEPQKFPITLIQSIQFLGSNDQKARAFQEFYSTSDALSAEYEAQDLRLLGAWTTRLIMGGKGEPFLNVDDLKGKSIRTTGGPVTTAVSLAGGNPVTMTTNEVYEALQRNVVDGYAFPLEGIYTYSLTDHTDFIVDPLAGGFSQLTMVINADVYNSLDPETQKVIDEVSAELSDHAVGVINERTAEICEKLIETDVKEFVDWTQDASDEWSDLASDTIRADWEKTAGENGVENPSKVFDEWLAALDGVDDPQPDAELACAQRFADAR